MAPTGLTATAAIEQVTLQWQAVDDATSYRMYVAEHAGVTTDDATLGDTTETTQAHSNLDPTVTYHYRVSAKNRWSEGPLSDETSAMPLPPPPLAPTGVSATPGDAQVVVTWSAAVGADTYRLYWDVTSGAAGNVIDDVSSPHTHTGLSNGTTYYYQVSASNPGGESPLSLEVSAMPQVPSPGAPQNLSATPGDGVVTLSWSLVAGASSYTIYWATHPSVTTQSNAIPGVSGPPYGHLGLLNGTAHYFRVSAMNPGGESPLSLEVSATPQPPPPSSPGFLQAQPSSRQVTLTWGSVSRADSYELYWDTQPGVTLADNNIGGLAVTDFLHDGLSNGVTHYYRVRARNGGGVSSLSQEVSAVPQFDTSLQEKLMASDAQAGDQFGYFVAISGDYLVVGAAAENDGAGAAYVYRRTAAGWQEVQRLVAHDAQARDQLGFSVAISGDYLVVGAAYEDGGAGDPRSDAGAAYVFRRTAAGWQVIDKLTASDAQAYDSFGSSVAMSGDYLVVGAWRQGGPNAGAAYVFERTGGVWQEVQKLTASDAQADDFFGYSVAMSGDYLVVGARSEDGAGSLLSNAGAAYVFERTAAGWQEVEKLMASDAQAWDLFGRSVGISDGYLVVGAIHENGGAGDPLLWAGAAYVFERTAAGWQEVTKLSASDAQANDMFGNSVAISGDYLVVGAWAEDGGAGDPLSGAGAAYVFQRGATGWHEVHKLVASDAQGGDSFGRSVAINGDYLAVGAAYEDGGAGDPLSGAGAVYVF